MVSRGLPRSALLALIALLSLALLAPVANANPVSELATTLGLRKAVKLQNIRQHQAAWQEIADDNGGTRLAGTAGYDESADYVVDVMTAAGYNVWTQEFTFLLVSDRTPPLLEQVSPNPTVYVNGIDYATMTYSGSGDATAALATPSGSALGCDAADFAGFPVGSIALVSRGVCTFRIKTDNATAAGASAILVYNNAAGFLSGTLGAVGGLSTIPSVGMTQALGQTLLALMGSGTVVMHVRTDTIAEERTTVNVFAESIMGDPDNVIVVGAHLDSVSRGPGINDNGSGSAAILEVARQIARQDRDLRNQLRFAWWGAEEHGLIGSTYYVNSLSQAERDQIALNLNFDMIGSPNFVRFVYDGDNSAFPVGTGVQLGPPGSGEIERVFVDYFVAQDLPSAPTPFSGRSDYGPFITIAGIPAGGLFTGAEGIKTAEQAAIYGGTAGQQYDPCYHLACDTFANNSNTALDQMSDAVAHATLHFARRDFAGNPLVDPAAAVGSSSSAGGGGGLHEEDHIRAER